MEGNMTREDECAWDRSLPNGEPCGACRRCCNEALARVEELEASRDTANRNMDAVRRYVERLESLFGGAEILARHVALMANDEMQRRAYEWLDRYENVQSIQMTDQGGERESDGV